MWDTWLMNVTGYLYWGVNQWNLGDGAKNATISAPPIDAAVLDSVRLPFVEWNVATCANPTISSWCSSLSWLQGAPPPPVCTAVSRGQQVDAQLTVVSHAGTRPFAYWLLLVRSVAV